ncbi:hypothetical protein L0128_18445 [candidate division KSB1 bacterium]|nr:hypothetical protein [candidate division KSB1 bacterium]
MNLEPVNGHEIASIIMEKKDFISDFSQILQKIFCQILRLENFGLYRPLGILKASYAEYVYTKQSGIPTLNGDKAQFPTNPKLI